MTTRKQAVDQLAALYKTYCPLLDKLVAAVLADNTPAPMIGIACSSTVGLPTATTDTLVREEQRQAHEIIKWAEIAWGEAAGATLYMLQGTPEELRDIAELLEFRMDGALRGALIGCCVRSRRLGVYLRNSPLEPVRDMMKRIARRYREEIAANGANSAQLKKDLAEEFNCGIGTVRQAILRDKTKHR